MASRLGVSARTFAKDVKAKNIPHIIVGKRQRFDPVTVELYLLAEKVESKNVLKFKPRITRNVKSKFADACLS